MDESVVAAMDTMLPPGADPLHVSVACEAVIAWAHARQQKPSSKSMNSPPEFFDTTGALVDWTWPKP